MKKSDNDDIFYPISGVNANEERCFFLHFEGFNILLDCGIPQDDESHSKLKQLAPIIDIILISHCTYEHLSGLPYLICECDCKAKIFATLPTIKMGEMTMYDHWLNIDGVKEIDLDKELTNVDTAFSRIQELKYTESHILKHESNENAVIIIQPFNSGYTLGGSVWKVTNEIDTVLYCMDFDIRQSSYLNGLDVKGLGSKPSMLVIDSKNSRKNFDLKDQERKLKEIICKCLIGQHGNVLLPTDAAGRSLELISIFEKLWDSQFELKSFGFYFLTHMSVRTVKTYASQQLQFMNNFVIKKFNEKQQNPFFLKHCKLVQDISKIDFNLPSLIITSVSDLECGFSRNLFEIFAVDVKNCVLLVDEPNRGTLGGDILEYIEDDSFPSKLVLRMRKKEALKGVELEEFFQKKKNEEEAEKKRISEEAQRGKIVTIKDDEEEEEDKEDEETEEEIVDNDPRLFLPKNMRYKSPFLMFPPMVEKKVEIDDYGEVVDVEELRMISVRMFQDDFIDKDEEMSDGRRPNNIIQKKKIEEEEKKFEIPLKLVEERVSLPLKCKFFYVPFDGRANSDTLRNIVQKLEPRQFVLVNGRSEDKKVLKNFCEKNNICRMISMPSMHEKVKLLTEDIYRVTLSSNLIDVLGTTMYEDYELSYFEGYFAEDPKKIRERELKELEKKEKKEKKENKMNDEGDDDSSDDSDDDDNIDDEEEEEGEDDEVKKKKKETVYDSPFVAKRNEDLGHKPFFIGNVRLNELRSELNNKGFTTQFKLGGGIICNNKILLTKDRETGKIKINGPLGSDYLAIREILYTKYCIL